MNYKETAGLIIKNIGGEKNVVHLEHCSTRLRFTLADYGKVDVNALKKIPGVLGVVMTAQCQVVIGNSVIEVYDEIMKNESFSENETPSVDKTAEKEPRTFRSVSKKAGSVILDFIVGVFQPLVPVIAGAGILKSLLLLFVMFGWTTKTSQFYVILFNIADAAFYFLPLIVAVSTATKLKCNRYVALASVGVLLLPSMTTLIAGGITILGIPVKSISYASQVFPALLCVLFLSFVEKLFNKISPKPIRVFFVPLMCFVISVPVTLVALGPLGFFIGEGFTNILLAIFDRLGWLAVTLLAVLLPFMISIGMHKALVPYAVSSIGQLGKELLYLPASLAHNISESGACFGVALRSKDERIRSTAISAGISALFGITEPALYGLTIQNKKALSSVMIGCAAGGAYVGIAGVEAYAAVGPGIASLAMFVGDSPRNIINAVIGAAIAFVVSLTTAFFICKNKADDSENPGENDGTDKGEHGKAKKSDGEVRSPADGKVIPLSEVPDDVFSAGVLGNGVAVIPEKGEIYSPVDGKIATVFDSKHAISLTADFGAEILIHVGLDTVNLNGEGFCPQVVNGQEIKKGQMLLKFDSDTIKSKGYNISTPIICANSEEFDIVSVKTGEVKSGDKLFDLISKE